MLKPSEEPGEHKCFEKHYAAGILCNFEIYDTPGQAPDKECVTENDFLISQPKHILWVLKRTVSLRRFF